MKRAPILVVEDNPDDLFAVQRALRKAKIENPVEVVTDGQSAIEYLEGTGIYADREAHPIPVLVLLDLKLPRVDGFEVLSWIRAQPALDDVVVVMLTSSDEDRDHRRAYSLGARSYLVKPPTAEALLQLTASLASLWGRSPDQPTVVLGGSGPRH
jgi:CheY-like chemotaxis protein